MQLDQPAAVDRRAEVPEGVEVRVEPPPTDVSPPGGGIRTSPKRASSGPASRNEARIRAARPSSTSVSATFVGAEPEVVVAEPLDLDAELLEHRDLRLGVADPRDVAEDQVLLRQQAGGEDRQRRVLVPGGDDLPAERGAALNHELLQSLARVATVSEPTMNASDARRRHGSCFANGSGQTPCESTRSAVEASMRAYARTLGRGRGAVGDHRPRPRPRLRALSRPRDRPSRGSRCEELASAATRRSVIDAVAGHAEYLDVPRDHARWRRRCTRSTSSRASWPRARSSGRPGSRG